MPLEQVPIVSRGCGEGHNNLIALLSKAQHAVRLQLPKHSTPLVLIAKLARHTRTWAPRLRRSYALVSTPSTTTHKQDDKKKDDNKKKINLTKPGSNPGHVV